MAFGKDKNRFLLKEGTIKVGAWTNPQDIGTNNTDPRSFFSGDDIGYFQQGSVSVGINDTYAEFKAGTPAVMIRKDLVERQFTITLALGQFNADAVELFKNTLSQKDYSVTTPTAQTWQLHFMGSDTRVVPEVGVLMETEMTNGNVFIIGMWKARFLADDNSIALAGTDYAVQNATMTAFPDANFDGVTDEAKKHYGIIAEKSA